MNVLKDIAEMDAYDLNFCLQKFVFEVRKQNGDKYPAKTLYDIFSMLNYYVQNYLGHSYSLFKSDEFLLSRKCLETATKETSASAWCYIWGKQIKGYLIAGREYSLGQWDP